MSLLNKRAAAKTLTWRLISTGVTAVGVLLITGNFVLAGLLGVVDTFVKTFLFYLHENAWSKSDYGRRKRK